MLYEKEKIDDKHFKSVLMAHLILVLHVLLIVFMVLLVIFFRGIVNYMIWIFLVGCAAIIASGYHFYKRMKEEGKTLREMLSSRYYGERSFEVSLLGGLASFKVGKPNTVHQLENDQSYPVRQLEDPDTVRIRELTELVRLLENNMITMDEYNEFKKHIIKP